MVPMVLGVEGAEQLFVCYTPWGYLTGQVGRGHGG